MTRHPTIPALKSLQGLELDNNIYVPLYDLFLLLEKKRHSHEPDIRRDNFKRSYKSSIIKQSDEEVIQLSTVLGYCYSNQKKSTFCAQVCAEVEHK